MFTRIARWGAGETNSCLRFTINRYSWDAILKAIIFRQQLLKLQQTRLSEISGLQDYVAGPCLYASVSFSQCILFAPDWGWQGCPFNKCAFGSCQRNRTTVVCNLWDLVSSCKHSRGSNTHLLKIITKTTTNDSVPSSGELPCRPLFLETTRKQNRRGKHISTL